MKHQVTILRLFLTRLPSFKNKKAIMTLAFAGILVFAGCTKKPIVVKPDPIVETVPNPEEYVKDPVGTVTIEATGEKVDLAKLKQKYGNLYRLVEPMTDKEIDDQYKAFITVWHQSDLITVENRKTGELEINIFGYLFPKTDEAYNTYIHTTAPIIANIIKETATSKDPVISSKFSFYFRPVGDGYYDFPYTNEMLESVKTGEVGSISKGDKEAFVRYYKICMDVDIQVRKEQGLDLTQQFRNAVPMIKEVVPETKTNK